MTTPHAAKKYPWVIIALCALLAHGLFTAWYGQRQTQATVALPPAPPRSIATIVTLGEPALLSRLISLWLQSQDVQAGNGIAWRALNYNELRRWLDLQLQLDQDNIFPLLAAMRLYGGVNHGTKVRIMVSFVQDAFPRHPKRYAPWMLEAAIIAKYRLGDPMLAQQIIEQLNRLAPEIRPLF